MVLECGGLSWWYYSAVVLVDGISVVVVLVEVLECAKYHLMCIKVHKLLFTTSQFYSQKRFEQEPMIINALWVLCFSDTL